MTTFCKDTASGSAKVTCAVCWRGTDLAIAMLPQSSNQRGAEIEYIDISGSEYPRRAYSGSPNFGARMRKLPCTWQHEDQRAFTTELGFLSEGIDYGGRQSERACKPAYNSTPYNIMAVIRTDLR